MAGWRYLAGYVAIATLAGGDCVSHPAGKMNRYEFSYDEPNFVGYDPMPPLVEGGGHARMLIEPRSSGCGGSHYPFSQVVSSDTTVAAVDYDGTAILITTGIAGTTEVQLLDDAGEVVDAIDVEVAHVDRVAAAKPSATIFAPGMYDLYVTMYAATGEALGAQQDLLQFEVTGSVTATAKDDFRQTDLVVAPVAPGDGNIVLTAPGGATSTVVLHVVTADAIASVIEPPGFSRTYDRDHQRWTVYTEAHAPDPVYGAACDWEVSDPSVHIDWERPQADFDGTAYESTAFALTHAGTYTVTCTIGFARLDIELSR